ncbi:MAG: hypothetical protein QXP84_07490 [Candidatus Korarchaeum sp.]
MFSKFGVWRVGRLTIADPLGFACFFDSHDPDVSAEVRFPSGLVVRGDAYVFYGGVETQRTDIPKDADLYVVVVSGYKEEMVRGIYGREVFVRGKITTIETKTKEGKKTEFFGVNVPIGKGQKIVFVSVIGLTPGDEYAKDDLIEQLNSSIAMLTAANSELEKRNAALTNELDSLKRFANEIVSKYETCRSAMDNLYFQLRSKLMEAEELISTANTIKELRDAAIKMIESLTGEKSIFRVKKKEADEIEKRLSELKKEVEKVG